MAWIWGDGFDCYTALTDALNGYWDSGPAASSPALLAGRFSGSRSFQLGTGANNVYLVKSSGQNDGVHHLSIAMQQTVTITGSTSYLYLQLLDGATAQCTVVFRSDGAILLNSGAAAGTNLATYSGAFPVINTWYQFEIEIVVHNSTGSFKVRKNGSASDDHSTTGIDTAGGTANNYANKLQVGGVTTGLTQQVDDLFWRSDASSVAWMGDIRCYTRLPASDASAQFARTSGGTNASCVDEAQQNTLTDYVYDGTVGHEDFYNIGTIATTPLTTYAVTTRAYVQKTDANSRTAAAQIKSGGTTAASPTLTLTTGWQWAWRTDTTNPATGSAWSAAAVAASTIGAKVIA